MRKNKKIDQTLLISFGKLKDESYDFEKIESYFRKNKNSSAFQILSDKTCNDLDFRELFMFLDRTNSKVGQQYLYNKLRTIASDSEETDLQERLIAEVTRNKDYRISIQKQLSKLNKNETFNIASLFQDDFIQRPKWYFVIQLLSFSSVLLLTLSFFVPKLLILLLFVFIANMLIHYWNKNNLTYYFGSVPQLLIMNSAARALYKDPNLREINPNLLNSLILIDKIRNRMSFFNLEVKLQADVQAVMWGFFELFKILFLIEPLVLFGSLKHLENKRKEVENVFVFVGQIDSIISIASLRAGAENYCIPNINTQKKIVSTDAYHPLIFNCIRNSVNVDKKSILLTGSNMSGKTSFIRTIGINVITGLTLNTCFAQQFSMPKTKIYSAIRISDDLMNDKSYYFEEVLTVKEMIEKSGDDNFNLFLMDEIFKGTNTVERISAGKAVLSSLSKAKNIVLVSTHDIELADLLKDDYELYHFSEIVNNNSVDFDYKLKEGKLKNRNAIQILQINNYPEDIIKEATEIAIKLDKVNIAKMV